MCLSTPISPQTLPPPPWHTKQRHTSFRSLAVNRSRLIFCFSLVCIGVNMSWSQLFIQIAAMHIFTRQIKSTSCLVFNILSWSKSWALMIEEEVETNYKNIYRRTTVISEFLLIFFFQGANTPALNARMCCFVCKIINRLALTKHPYPTHLFESVEEKRLESASSF